MYSIYRLPNNQDRYKDGQTNYQTTKINKRMDIQKYRDRRIYSHTNKYKDRQKEWTDRQTDKKIRQIEGWTYRLTNNQDRYEDGHTY